MAASKPVAGKNLGQILTRNMKWLQDHIGSDLEKQMLVISYVEELENNCQTQKATPKKRKICDGSDAGDAPDDDDAPPMIDIPMSILLSRQSTRYSGWPKRLLIELFCYCEPRVWSLARKKVDSVLMAKQCMEFAFEIRCLEDRDSDRPASRVKKDTYDSLRQLYLANGRRFLKLNLKDGFVDWCAEGFYAVSDERTDEGRKVTVTDKCYHKVSTIPSELVSGYTPKFTNDDIQNNYSWSKAKLHFGKSDDHLLLSQFFPKIRRSLTRKLSDELGATKAAIADGRVGDASEGMGSKGGGGSNSSESAGKSKKRKTEKPTSKASASAPTVPRAKPKAAQKVQKPSGPQQTHTSGADAGDVPSPSGGEVVATASAQAAPPKGAAAVAGEELFEAGEKSEGEGGDQGDDDEGSAADRDKDGGDERDDDGSDHAT